MKNRKIAFTEDEFLKIYRQSWLRLYSVACKYVSANDVEQLVENVFEELWFRKIKPQSPLEIQDWLLSQLKDRIYRHMETSDKVNILKSQSATSYPILLINKLA